MRSPHPLLLAAACVLLLTACRPRREHDVPLSRIDVQVEVVRFDQQIHALTFDSIDAQTQRLARDHGDFFSYFAQGVIRIGDPGLPETRAHLLRFVSDPMIRNVYADVNRTFGCIEPLNRALTDAFARYHYHFPTRPIPRVYSFVSGFNHSLVLGDSLIGIGLDRYLGSDYQYYPRLGIYAYITRNMHPAKIPSDVVHTWLSSEFPFHDSIYNLLNNMIHEGKLLYLTRALLPRLPDTLIFGYTAEQLRWCLANEGEMWDFLVEHRMLFDTNRFTIRQLIGSAPFSRPFPQESPGRVGAWIGYRIVDRFMQKNPDYTLAMLMEQQDYQRILRLSRYKP